MVATAQRTAQAVAPCAADEAETRPSPCAAALCRQRGARDVAEHIFGEGWRGCGRHDATAVDGLHELLLARC